MNDAAQVLIGLSGALAIVLALARHPGLNRYAPIAGIVGQPFWLTVTFEAGQWGMFAVSVAYTFVWAWALWREWA